MKARSLILTVLLLITGMASAQNTVRFNEAFVDSTLRIDFYHTGDSKEEILTVDLMLKQGTWAGNPMHLLDPFGYGHYRVKVFDASSHELLYSRGYDAYFDEYRTTVPAGEGTKKTYHESVLIPFPRRPVRIVIESKDARNQFHQIFTRLVDPSDYHILVPRHDSRDKVFFVLQNGVPHKKLDIAIVAEGYTVDEENTFKADLEKYKEILLSLEPYKSHADQINISGVFRASAESGVTQPREGISRNTAVRSSFNALDTDRYLLTEENRALRDIASAVPYDALCIMVNSSRYGGGGLYNDYTIFTAHNAFSQTVFLHEFGHGFAGLGDEYYDAAVSYVDFYPHDVEPVEPNLTALLDPAHLKWKDLVTPGTPIPTEWGKAEYDSLQKAMRDIARKRDEVSESLNRGGVVQDSLVGMRKNLDEQLRRMRQRITDILTNGPEKGKVGAFEGAGYMSKGLYRPAINCMMFSNEQKTFCQVCERAVARMIDYYAGGD
jgi:hypothetical protein